MSDTEHRVQEYASEDSGSQPGTRLAEARAALKLSAADVARQLKLSVAQVEALESGQFDSLPGPVFVRGFIRNYARLVKLDPDDLLRAGAHNLPQHAPRPEVPLSQDIPFPSGRPRRWRKFAWLAAVLIAAAAAYEFIVSTEETVVTTHPIEVTPPPLLRETPKEERPPATTVREPSAHNAAAEGEARSAARPGEPPAKAVEMATSKTETAKAGTDTPAKAATIASAPEQTVATAPAPERVAATDVAAKQAPSPNAAAPMPEVKAAVAPSPAGSADAPPTNPAERRVTLEFEDESWVEIRDRDGKLLLFQLNLPGTRQVVRGLPPLSFVIGNAHGVRLTYEDRAVDLERHTKTDVARLTLE